MPTSPEKLKKRIKALGFSDAAISAAWPSWWSAEAEQSVSARAELSFSLARKLGLDPRSLLEGDKPRFFWQGAAKFKGLRAETAEEQRAIGSYGVSLGRVLVGAVDEGPPVAALEALSLRQLILKSQPYIRLVDLLGLCWAIGIPVIHLRVFPLSAKRMCAMAVRVGDRFAVLLGKDAQYPASIAYYLAHELGHIVLGHLLQDAAVVDLADPLEEQQEDPDEVAADRFAMTLLTGQPDFKVATEAKEYSASALAHTVLRTAERLRIEPGTLALCFGHSSGNWPTVFAAMRKIYDGPKPVWQEVNKLAAKQLQWDAISSDMSLFLAAVMGGEVGN